MKEYSWASEETDPSTVFFFQVLIKITTSKRISIDTAKKRALF